MSTGGTDPTSSSEGRCGPRPRSDGQGPPQGRLICDPSRLLGTIADSTQSPHFFAEGTSVLHHLISPTLVLLVFVAATPGRLEASPIEISGSGTSAANAPNTTITRPNTSYAFSFVVDDPLVGATTAINATVLSVSYQLGGVAVLPPFGAVAFYNTSDRGLFDLNFYSPNRTLSFYGAQIFDRSTRALIPGTYASTTGQNGSTTIIGSGTVTVGAIANAVPEPGVLILAASGLPVGLGFWGKRRRKAAAG